MDYTKAIRELDNKQDRIYYRTDIKGYSNSLDLVIHPIEEVNKVVSDNKIF